MDRKTIMAALEKRATDARIELHTLSSRAGISFTVISRWRRGKGVPKLPTIEKLEAELDKVLAEKSAAPRSR
jgi:transcriptional regulator with XRE-family HTH domain